MLYCALIGYIHYEAPVEEQNFSTLIEFINAMEVREDDEEFKNPVDLMFDALESEKPNHFAVRQYKKYKLAAGVVCSKRLLNQAVGKSLRTHNLKPKKGAQVMRKNEKITALYERLSRDDFGKDDDQQRESNSISNQKAMLEEFAARQGFTNIVHFTDDGISGTCFDRPGFLAMMKEVEAGNVEYLCIKDMSRMGRDYLKVGQIMEILRQRGVRLIAINDGVDSARGDDDFTPFRNIMNEYYARDTSRKIRSTFQSKGKSGKHLTGTVIYGYLWNEARDQSILISCGSRLAPFDIPQLREIMAYDELQLDRIGDRKTAVFFTISDTTPTYNFLVALAFSQMFNLLCERADNVHGGRLPHHVRVLWDEAANTGQVPQLEKLVAVIRSREISLTLFYQQMAQCKAIYDKHAETILGNMDSVIFLGGRESSTIKEISENWLGKATIYMQTDGRSKGQSESYNQNTQRLGRELMTPAELATMPGDRCILQLRGLPPFYSPKYDLKQHPNYKYTAEADRVKNVFDLDKLINRRRRPGLNEVCEVYEADGTDAAPISEDEDILNYDDVDDPDAFV